MKVSAGCQMLVRFDHEYKPLDTNPSAAVDAEQVSDLLAAERNDLWSAVLRSTVVRLYQLAHKECSGMLDSWR
jgi:hypothetical protein